MPYRTLAELGVVTLGSPDITRSAIESEFRSRGLYPAKKERVTVRKYSDRECIKMAVDKTLKDFGLMGKRGPVEPGKWSQMVTHAYNLALAYSRQTRTIERWPSGLL